MQNTGGPRHPWVMFKGHHGAYLQNEEKYTSYVLRSFRVTFRLYIKSVPIPMVVKIYYYYMLFWIS